jgi:hypothetical protein
VPEKAPNQMSNAKAKKKVLISSINFSKILGTVSEDMTQLPYEEKSKSYQHKIRARIEKDVLVLFDQHKIRNTQDYLDILDFIRKGVTEVDERKEVVKAEEAIAGQLATLSLPQRNDLHKLLTHRNGEINDEMLNIFPSLRRRSTLLLEKTKRKIREDKIDLSLITSFMHDYCR